MSKSAKTKICPGCKRRRRLVAYRTPTTDYCRDCCTAAVAAGIVVAELNDAANYITCAKCGMDKALPMFGAAKGRVRNTCRTCRTTPRRAKKTVKEPTIRRMTNGYVSADTVPKNGHEGDDDLVLTTVTTTADCPIEALMPWLEDEMGKRVAACGVNLAGTRDTASPEDIRYQIGPVGVGGRWVATTGKPSYLKETSPGRYTGPDQGTVVVARIAWRATAETLGLPRQFVSPCGWPLTVAQEDANE